MKSFLLLFFCCSIHITFAQESKRFEFVYSVKTGAVPSTYYSASNIYIRDMVIDPPEKIKIKLNKKERKQIEDKVREIIFFSYPDEYKYVSADSSGVISMVKPCSKYTLIIFMDEKQKQVSWTNCVGSYKSVNNQYENLVEVSNLINKIIYNKRKMKKAKPLRAMYL